MNTKKAKKALMKIAEKEGISLEEVRREIEIAIAEARKSTDPKAQAFWKSVPSKGDFPTPEEAIAFIVKNVNKI